MGPLVRVRSGARLIAAVLMLGTAPFALQPARAAQDSTADVPLFVPVTPLAPYHIEKVGNRGIKLTSKNAVNGYAITVLGSNTENAASQTGDAWQKSLGVEVEGRLGSFLKTDLRTRFTELERAPDLGPFGPQSAEAIGKERRALEEFSVTTQFLGDRISVTSSRRASDYAGLDPALSGSSGAYEQDKFKAWLWRSGKSSLSIEGVTSRIDSSFQTLTQPMHSRNEESQQLKSKLSYGRAGVFVTQRESQALAPDNNTALSRQSDFETGASLGLSDLRQSGTLSSLLPDSVWVSTNHGTVEKGDPIASMSRPLEKSAIGMTRTWGASSVNLSYWRSAVESAASVPDEWEWRGRGMDVGGTLRSGRVSVSGNLSWYTADNMAALNNTAESNLNGSLFLTYSRAAWPKFSAGLTNYAYQAAYFDYSGLEQSSLMRYEFAVDSTPLLSAWADPQAQLKFIASYQDNGYSSQWSQADNEAGMQNVFFGFKFTRSLLP